MFIWKYMVMLKHHVRNEIKKWTCSRYKFEEAEHYFEIWWLSMNQNEKRKNLAMNEICAQTEAKCKKEALVSTKIFSAHILGMQYQISLKIILILIKETC